MFHFKMFRFRVSSKEKERDMWGTSERKRELAFLSGRTGRLSTESVNNNAIIISTCGSNIRIIIKMMMVFSFVVLAFNF